MHFDFVRLDAITNCYWYLSMDDAVEALAAHGIRAVPNKDGSIGPNVLLTDGENYLRADHFVYQADPESELQAALVSCDYIDGTHMLAGFSLDNPDTCGDPTPILDVVKRTFEREGVEVTITFSADYQLYRHYSTVMKVAGS